MSQAVIDTILVTNTTFRDNDVNENNVNAPGLGGGLYAQLFGGTLTVSDNTKFESNSADNGGGLYLDVAGDEEDSVIATVEITGNTLQMNEATGIGNYSDMVHGLGGAIGGRLNRDATVTISDSLVAENEAYDGGGIHLILGKPINITSAGEFHAVARSTSLTLTR